MEAVGRSWRDVDVLADVAAIEGVLKRYCFLVDKRDVDGIIREVFAGNGSDDHGEGPRRGAAELERWFRDNLANIATSAHLLSNVVVDVEGDVARASSYVTAWVWTVAAEDGNASREATYVVVARYEDRLVRTSSGWLIAERIVGPAGAGRHVIALGTVPSTQTGLSALVARTQPPSDGLEA